MLLIFVVLPQSCRKDEAPEDTYACQERRFAASNVFYNHETLAIDYAIESSEPKKWYQRKLKNWKTKGAENSEATGLWDLEVVKLHMPNLLGRRNASSSITRDTPETMQQNGYELPAQTIKETPSSPLKN